MLILICFSFDFLFEFVFAVGWQRSHAALQYHGNKSAFSKLEADTNKLPRKRDSSTIRDSLQDRLVEALESSRPQKVRFLLIMLLALLLVVQQPS